MGGFICVALIVIALLWCKIWPLLMMADTENALKQGENKKDKGSK